MATADHPSPTGRRARLKASTRSTHGSLDQRIMAFQPFASRERYGAFLQAQYRLHRDVQALFADAALNAWLPQLAQRCRLALLEQDLQDLGIAVPPDLPAPVFSAGAAPDRPTALGWLYTVEGSNLGAAFLLKAAARLGLDGSFGARHLAPHPDGRAAHWRDFTAQLDEAVLTPEEEARVDDGSRAAFSAARGYVEQHCALPATA